MNDNRSLVLLEAPVDGHMEVVEAPENGTVDLVMIDWSDLSPQYLDSVHDVLFALEIIQEHLERLSSWIPSQLETVDQAIMELYQQRTKLRHYKAELEQRN